MLFGSLCTITVVDSRPDDSHQDYSTALEAARLDWGRHGAEAGRDQDASERLRAQAEEARQAAARERRRAVSYRADSP
jgi:hypothetical protein